VGVWIIFYVGSGLELKHMGKRKIKLPWGDFYHLRGGLAAGTFTGAGGVEGPYLRAASALSSRS
jgi:hypothetical protein